jgi:DsbC/DsbD-like thiol-disulfide interchange protein
LELETPMDGQTVPASAVKRLGAAMLLMLAPASGSLAARSDWAQADEAQMRLLMTVADDGSLIGGVDIILEPGWYTYWRNPGEAGVPPIFDFDGSDNVADVEVLYPAPMRKEAGGAVSLIYQDEVVFPLMVRPVDAARPVTLRLAATFGVCSEICIPTQASSEVTFSAAGDSDPLSAERLKGFEERVPVRPKPGIFDIEEVTEDGDALTIEVRAPESSYSDLFADPPDGWYIGQPALVERVDGISRYRLSLAGRPRGSQLKGLEFRFVAVAGGQAIEETVTIP